jgi:peptidoglycan/xylan/chitin deacetylase (PgdA/CDA1 family)
MDGALNGMPTQSRYSSVWMRMPTEAHEKLHRCLEIARSRTDPHASAFIYFRADDVAVPGKQFVRLMELFRRYRVPLCLGVVPAWLSTARWREISRLGGHTRNLWCWHQHGWRHINHQPHGRKLEFGPGRSAKQIQTDLNQGKERLESIMGRDFLPVFTPPWNRCDQNTLDLLKKLGYAGVSRTSRAEPQAPAGLPEFPVHVDLHTRKDPDPVSGWSNLSAELLQALSGDRCGFMIHHQRMNEPAFAFLEVLLEMLVRQDHFRLVHFGDLVKDGSDGVQE